MVKKPEHHPTREEFNQHETRIVELEKKVAQLLEAIANQTDQPPIEIAPEPEPTSEKPSRNAPSSRVQQNGNDMSPAFQRIIGKMKSGDSDGAFRDFQALPRKELSQQPVTAATIAAAICVTKGDFQAGIKALEQVQQFSDDPRIEQIKLKLIEQAKKPNS